LFFREEVEDAARRLSCGFSEAWTQASDSRMQRRCRQLGAQQLAACDYPSAIGTFNHAATRLTPPEDSTMIRMLDGYSLMAR